MGSRRSATSTPPVRRVHGTQQRIPAPSQRAHPLGIGAVLTPRLAGARTRHPPQAPAGALLPAANVDAAPGRARALAARTRLRRPRAGDLHGAAAQGSGARQRESEHRCAWHRTVPALRLSADRAAVRPLRACTPSAPSARASRGSSARSSRSRSSRSIFAVVSGEHFSSYYLFYGSLAFALLLRLLAARASTNR